MVMSDVEKLIEAMRQLFFLGLINPRGGNGSVKVGNKHMAVTPSGLGKQWLTVEDLVICDIHTGEVVKGGYKPTVELGVHLGIYRALAEAKAVLHAHPPIALAFFDAGLIEWWNQPLVEVSYSIGKVSIVEEKPPGSPELADAVVEAVKRDGSRIIAVPHHGVFAWGKSVEEAMDAIVALETVAKYVAVKALLGKLIK